MNFVSVYFKLHNRRRHFFADTPVVVDCIKLTNASTFLQTWCKIKCPFLSNFFSMKYVFSVGSNGISQFLISHRQQLPIVTSTLH